MTHHPVKFYAHEPRRDGGEGVDRLERAHLID